MDNHNFSDSITSSDTSDGLRDEGLILLSIGLEACQIVYGGVRYCLTAFHWIFFIMGFLTILSQITG
ncbi:hypothetical protein [Acetobacterium woodii]|uniref:hypothetical protein n=1 Tax=Acetobacterium woodii TaxID=33952 RepID=UPI0011AE1BDA|nr:hypothetical protein [Acetobacterium woodii]